VRTVDPLVLLCALAVSGCAAPAAPAACSGEAGAPMTVYELFFGRSVAGRAPVSDAEWDAFLAEVVTARFPDGFTVLDGQGQWRNPRTGEIVRDPTKVLLVAAPPGVATRAAIEAVRQAYEARYRQESVGLLAHAACADFGN
jgi:hypothetical protein